MSTDLAGRITGLAAAINARLKEDEARAWAIHDVGKCDALLYEDNMAAAAADTPNCDCGHPASTLRQVAATRSLVAAILAEPHNWNPGDEYYSCPQAVDYTSDDQTPGSACTDPDRAGQPCDCGRDQRVGRLLAIIASQWEHASGS